MNTNIDFDLYKMFYNVVQYGSFSKTAEELFISQSAVTQAIKKLEDQLGGVLFIRSKHGVVLTEAGKTLYEYIAQSLETIGNAEDIFSKYQNLEKGSIRIGGGSTLANLILQDALIKFSKDYPNINISLQNMVTNQAIEKLSTGNLDLVLLNLVDEIKYDNIKIVELKETEDIFFVNKEFAKTINNGSIKLSDLENYKVAFPAKGSNSRILLEEKLANNEIKIDADYEFSSGSLLTKFVEKTETIGYITKSVIEEKLKDGSLVEIKLDIIPDKRRMGLAVLDKKITNAATLKLVEYIKEFNQ